MSGFVFDEVAVSAVEWPVLVNVSTSSSSYNVIGVLCRLGGPLLDDAVVGTLRVLRFCCSFAAEARVLVSPLNVVVVSRGEDISQRTTPLPDPDPELFELSEECFETPVSRSAASQAASRFLNLGENRRN